MDFGRKLLSRQRTYFLYCQRKTVICIFVNYFFFVCVLLTIFIATKKLYGIFQLRHLQTQYYIIILQHIILQEIPIEKVMHMKQDTNK